MNFQIFYFKILFFCHFCNVFDAKKLPPVLFVSHGGPTSGFRQNFDEETNINHYDKIVSFGKELRQNYNIKSILVISAHFVRNQFSIVINENPETIHDHGFNEVFSFKCEAKNDIDLSKKIQQELINNGIQCLLDTQWGYDHGSWVITKMLFPQLDLPILSLSLKSSFNEEEHVKVGQIIRKFREQENCLIIGSGSSTHNLQDFFYNYEKKIKSRYIMNYQEFSDFLNKNALDTSESERINEILKVKLNKNYKISHPSDEHFYPYFVTIGASSGLKGKSLIKFFSDEGLDYSSFYFE